MKSSIIFFFLLITQFCLSQNTDLTRQEAITFFNNGKVNEALQTLEKITDPKVLEDTDINIWKKHCRQILNYKFREAAAINDSIKIIYVKNTLLMHFGVYNTNTKKYIINPVYDDIPNKKKFSNYIILHLNNQNTLIDVSGKTIIPLGDYKISYGNGKYIFTTSTENALISVYNLQGEKLISNLKSIQSINYKYFITQNNSNKFGLFDIDKQQFLLDGYDEIKEVLGNFNSYANGVFIKRENQTAFYSFTTNSILAENAFDKVVSTNRGLIFSRELNKDNPIKKEEEKDRLLLVKKNSKFGIFNLSKNKYDTQPVYDSINGYYNCLQNKVWKNLKYEYTIKEDYPSYTDAVVFLKNNLFGIKSIANKTITESEYDKIEQIRNDLFLTKMKELWGWIFITKEKNTIVKPQFDHVYLSFDHVNSKSESPYEPFLHTSLNNQAKKFSLDGNLQVKGKNETRKKENVKNDWSYTFPNLNRTLTVQRKSQNPIEENSQLQDLYGLNDKNGNEIVKPIYTEIDKGLNGNQYLVTYDNRGVGVIDENGKIIIPTDYRSIECFDNKFYIVKNNQDFGLFDKDGKEVFPVAYQDIKLFLDGFYLVKDKDEMYKIVDAERRNIFVFPKFTESVYSFEKIVKAKEEVFYNLKFRLKEGYEYWHDQFLVKIENNVGRRVLDKYKIRGIYENKIVEIESHYLIGFYNLDNQKLIEPKFKEIARTYLDKSIYCKTEKYFDIILDENLNSSFSTDHISSVQQDIIFYERNGKYGFFDKKNQKTKNTFHNISIQYPIYSSDQKLYKFYDTSKKSGLVSNNGKIIIKANQYDLIYDSSVKGKIENTKFKKEELEKILICINKSNEKEDKIDFFTLYGNKISSVTVPKKNYSFNVRSGLVTLTSSEENLFFDLNKNKIVLEIDDGLILDDIDGGFTVLKKRTSVEDQVMAQKYSKNGNLIEERLIERSQDNRYLQNWNFNIIQKKGNKYGITNVDEKSIVYSIYDTLVLTIDSVYIAKKGHKFGIIDCNNNVLLNFEYDKIETKYLTQYVNANEQLVTKFDMYKDKRLPPETSLNFLVSKNYKTGILDSNLKSVLPIEYDSFSKERAIFGPIIARKNSSSMVYDFQGNFIFKVECDSLINIQNRYPNYYKIYKNGKQGCLNQEGKLIFPIVYSKAENVFSENLTIVENDSKKFIANSKGEIISAGYDEIKDSKFYNHLEIKKDNKFGLMNTKGTIVIPAIYDSLVQILDYRYMVVSLNGMEGLIDLNANENNIAPIKIPIVHFKILEIANKECVIVSDLFKTGVVDLNNKIIIPKIYYSVNYDKERKYFLCDDHSKGDRTFITANNVKIKVEE